MSSTLGLNGKPPASRNSAGVCQNGLCTLVATYDFTTEMRSLAAQDGGEFLLRVDPIAPLAKSEPVFSSVAIWVFHPAVNHA